PGVGPHLPGPPLGGRGALSGLRGLDGVAPDPGAPRIAHDAVAAAGRVAVLPGQDGDLDGPPLAVPEDAGVDRGRGQVRIVGVDVGPVDRPGGVAAYVEVEDLADLVAVAHEGARVGLDRLPALQGPRAGVGDPPGLPGGYFRRARLPAPGEQRDAHAE